ncbi:MAG: SARP family transcriptional regulator, partial [Actinobacteria bacterium 13_1_20CM_3_71_11]
RQRLVEELGTDPGPELQAIHQALLRGRPAPPSAAVPAQLPLDVRGFTGRERELSRLDGILATAGEQPTAPTAVVISALWGTAGVGKTALAVHWAHRVAERFPDGQLYVNLRGFDPSGPAMTPAEAVRGFLDALGAAPHQIPVSLSAQVGLYRSLLAGKRVLVALDNAASAEQVRPLLPGAPGCLVVVTSRNQLTSLVAAEGARPLPLDLLTPDEARQLLTRRLGVDRVAAEPSAVAEIVALCAGLPLALAIVAARAATQPEYALADLAAELRGLDTLSGGDAATDVRAVFSWSYQALGGTAARLFRLLGLHPGPDIARDAAASLAGEPVDALLAELAGAHLVAVQTPGRYSFHDLLRAYAVEQAHAVDSEADRRAAVRRLVDYYVQTAHAAAVAVQPHRDLGTPPDAAGGVTPTPLDAAPPALDWFTAEHAVLMGILDRAVREGFDLHAWHLAWVLMTFFDLRGHWHDWADAARVALGAAERLGDRPRVAQSHRGVAGAYTQLGRYEDAYEHYRRAYLIYGELGDVMGQGRTSLTLSQVFDRQARYREALSHGEQALSFFRAAGHTVGQARALNAIGWYHAQLHDYEQALACCEPALELLQEVGDQRGTAETWDSIGYAQHHLGRYAEAVSSYRNAIALCRELGDRYHEASCLNHLGDTYLAAGDADAARRAWQAGLDIHGRLDRPGGDELRAKLAALAPSPAPAG